VAVAAPVLDADGELVPTPTFIQEIIALHPMAYATVSARMIAGSGSLTLCLILHCAYLLLRSYPDEDDAVTPASPLLRIACTCRVIAAIPRPYAWWRIYSLHNDARKQSSSLRVAQRCLAASKDRWVRLNDCLSRVYNVWLLCVVFRVAHGYITEGGGRSLFEQHLFGHTLMCVASICSTHVLGAVFMLLLIYYPNYYHDAETQNQRALLERCSSRIEVDEAMRDDLSDDPCIICFDAFDSGQQTRRLTPCGHLFHTSCIDEWLERRLRSVPRLACPVCSVLVDDTQPEEESDPSVARDLAWLTELRRSHPGFFW